VIDWRQRGADPAFSGFLDDSLNPTFQSGVVFAGRFFVIGTLVDEDLNETPAIWMSADRLAWQKANIPDLHGVSDLVVGPGGLLAVADPLWLTTNGTDWTAVTDTDFEGQGISRVGATGDGFVALGSLVWTSQDGLEWEVAASQSGLLLAQSGVHKIVRSGDQLLAVAGGVSLGRPLEVWTSTNLVDWTKAGELPHSRNVRSPVAAVGPLGWIVTGSNDPDSGDRTNHIWLSADGLSWQEVTTAIGPVSDVFVDAVGFVAVGFLFIGTGCALDPSDIQGLTWTSTDGRSWTEMPQEEFLYKRIDHLFRNGRTLIGVGLSYDPEVSSEASGSVWTARLPDLAPAGPGPTPPAPTPEPSGGCGPG